MTGQLPTDASPGQPSPDDPVESIAQLEAWIAAGGRASEDRRLGVEYERLPLRPDGTAAAYDDPRGGVRQALEWLIRRGFEPVQLDGHLLGLRGPRFDVSLEPGAQLEAVLPPLHRAREVRDGLREWRDLLVELARATGLHVVALGLQPMTPVPDIAWIPRERYALMRRHLGARGRLAHHMMKATAGFQLNVDWTSEEDAASLVRTCLALSPLVNAMLVDSPLEEGRPNGYLSRRPTIWMETDPKRCGLLPWVFEEGFSFRRYVEWALDVTVMFVVREGRWLPLGDVTFRRFLGEGHPAAGRARHDDFVLHLTTLFPEVRVKRHVEIRGMDSCDVETAAAATALWRGVLHDEAARAEAEALLPRLPPDERLALHLDAGRDGLRARLRGVEIRSLARQLVRIAGSGLDRMAQASDEDSEAPLLEPLHRACDGLTAAEELLGEWERGPEALLERL